MSLKIVNLSKRFKDKWVLRDISFEVAPGEIFGIAGPSGAGKSTLINAIAAHIPSSGGSISKDGIEVPTVERRGWLCSSNPTDGVFNLKRFFGNPGTVEDLFRRLSTRIAQANDFVLIDELPWGNDAVSRERVSQIISEVCERKLGLIIASNDFSLILTVCDRAAVLADTEIKQIDTPQVLYEHPAGRAVASATGSCNLFPARRLTSSKAETPEFHTIAGGHRLFAESLRGGTLGAINQNVTLGIRPEHVSISFGASFPEDNLLRATISAVRFLGPTTLIDLDSNGLKLQSLVLRLVGLSVGDECILGLPPQRIHIFRD